MKMILLFLLIKVSVSVSALLWRRKTDTEHRETQSGYGALDPPTILLDISHKKYSPKKWKTE